jgi:hypothetical protein
MKVINTTKILGVTLVLMGTLSNLFAQQSMTFYNMQSVSQSNYINPARMPDNKINIGLPGISNSYFSVSNSGFAFSDLVKKNGDSLDLDFNSFLSALSDKNYMSLAAHVDALSVGVKIGQRNYLSFNITAKNNVRFSYDKDPFELLINGNAPFIGKNKSLNVGVNAAAYIEYGVGFARTFMENKLSVGGRLKYLSGLYSINTANSNVHISTNDQNYGLEITSNIEINTAGLDEDNDSTDVSDLIFGGNNGISLDLGGTYRLNDEWEFSASLLDLGSIKWTENVTNYVSKEPGKKLEFEGLEWDEIFNDTTEVEESFEELADSLEDQFDLLETNKSYSTALPSQLYLGANYYLNENTNIGGLLYTQFFDGRLISGIGLSFNKKFSRVFSVNGSYSYWNREAANIGAGFSANLGPVQFYMVSDNILAAMNWDNAQSTNIRFALNLRFGYDKRQKEGKYEEEFDENPKRGRRKRRKKKVKPGEKNKAHHF